VHSAFGGASQLRAPVFLQKDNFEQVKAAKEDPQRMSHKKEALAIIAMEKDLMGLFAKHDEIKKSMQWLLEGSYKWDEMEDEFVAIKLQIKNLKSSINARWSELNGPENLTSEEQRQFEILKKEVSELGRKQNAVDQSRDGYDEGSEVWKQLSDESEALGTQREKLKRIISAGWSTFRSREECRLSENIRKELREEVQEIFNVLQDKEFCMSTVILNQI